MQRGFIRSVDVEMVGKEKGYILVDIFLSNGAVVGLEGRIFAQSGYNTQRRDEAIRCVIIL